MTALLEKVRARGIGVELEGSRLKIVNASKLSGQQREWLRERKPLLILELLDEQKPAISEVVEPVEDSADNLPPLLNIAEILSIIDGSDEKEATRRFGELLARPKQAPVVCGDCKHFTRDSVGDGHGVGSCAVNAATYPACWPNKRYCESFSEGRSVAPVADNPVTAPMVCIWSKTGGGMVLKCAKPDIYDGDNHNAVGCRNCGSMR